MSTSTSLKRRKGALRPQMRQARDAIPDHERRDKARAIEERLFRVAGLAGARTVLCFSSIGSEVPTAGIIERLHAGGHRVAVPRIVNGEIEAAAFRPGDPVITSAFGISEPANAVAVPVERIDAVITPGLAFDRDGFRLGYGGGYFDRFLRRCRPEALRVGICFALQIVARVPHGRNDEQVDLLVTEDETIRSRRSPPYPAELAT